MELHKGQITLDGIRSGMPFADNCRRPIDYRPSPAIAKIPTTTSNWTAQAIWIGSSRRRVGELASLSVMVSPRESALDAISGQCGDAP
jgi:hypothetical protein